jgi:hypothetical protein
MICKSIAFAIAVVWLIVPAMPQIALADDATPDTQGGRYIFNKQADGQGNGYVRLDTQTGAVSLCSQKTVGWACEAAPEDRAVLESEIARLRSENAALKTEIIERGLPLPPGVAPEPPAAQNGELTVHLPSDADIDRMVAFAGHVWHRFMEAVARAQQQILNKS